MGLLIGGIICGIICSRIANSKGRNGTAWFFLGIMFGVFAIIFISFLSNEREQYFYREHVARENRRLKEQLKQEQVKSEAFRGHVARRLDTHDHVLRVDTRQGPAIGAANTAGLELEDDSAFVQPCVPGPSKYVVPGRQAVAQAESWYYDGMGKQVGPISKDDLMALLGSRQIHWTTLVWRAGFPKWVQARDVQDLQVQEELQQSGSVGGLTLA